MKVKKSFAQILEGIDGSQQMKLERKLPDWAALGAEVPTPLALEQCSSSPAAAFKAALARELAGGCLRGVCDITGGLGSDCAAFARLSEKVWYFERDERLVEAARRNFALLGLGNIETLCAEVGPGTPLPDCDLIYADPARRTSGGRKVFRMEDCAPDIGALAPALLRRSPLLMVKLSPMADISAAASRFGEALREVYVVSLGGEVKELLCILTGENAGLSGIGAVELGGEGVLAEFRFSPEEEKTATMDTASRIEAGMTLFEPSAALRKSGAFKLPCRRFGLEKLAVSTHLYVAVSAEAAPAALFKRYMIEEVLPLGRASIDAVASRRLSAAVSARNIRIDSDALARRLRCTPGGDMHIFGCGSVCAGNVLLLCRRLA